MRNLLCLLVASAFLAGCAGPKLAPPSGRPEVTIAGHTVDEVRAAVVAAAVGRGYCKPSSTG